MTPRDAGRMILPRALPGHRATVPVRTILQSCFLAAFLCFLAAIVFHAFFEPEPHKALTNLEAAAAVAFIACICCRAVVRPDCLYASTTGRWPVFLPLLTVLPFLISVRAPLLFDSYGHVVAAGTGSFTDAVHRAYVAADSFFRPLGYIDYWLEYKWAGFHPWVWHLDGLLIHLIATYLVFVLCRKLRLSSLGSAIAALFFGLHGTNPEDVFWTAARFDELAASFVLLTLILACQYIDRKRTAYVPLMLACCVCALLSKESAFCIAGLAACCLWCRRTLDTRGLKTIAELAAVSIAVFSYRYWVLGGIGGYRDAHGNSMALHLNIMHLLEILLFRIWGVLLFPINWSVAPQIWLSACLISVGCAAALCAFDSKPHRRMIIAALAFCVVGISPAMVGHLASLTATISGSRVYYIPSIGLALLIGAAYEGFSTKRLASVAVTVLLIFQSAILVHNILIWRNTAYLAKRTCVAFAQFSDDPQPLRLSPLPRLHDGVYFLANGFSDCVFVNTGKRIAIAPATSRVENRSVFRWDEASKSIKRESPQ